MKTRLKYKKQGNKLVSTEFFLGCVLVNVIIDMETNTYECKEVNGSFISFNGKFNTKTECKMDVRKRLNRLGNAVKLVREKRIRK